MFAAPPATPGSTTESLDFEEASLTAFANQLVGEHWFLGARYRLSEARLRDQLLGIPNAVLAGADSRLVGTMQQVSLSAGYQHPCGFFGEFQSLWVAQSNRGYTVNLPGDDFWQFNVVGGYRFKQRKAEVSVGLFNLTDQDYRLAPLNLHSELPRNRTLGLSLKFHY